MVIMYCHTAQADSGALLPSSVFCCISRTGLLLLELFLYPAVLNQQLDGAALSIGNSPKVHPLTPAALASQAKQAFPRPFYLCSLIPLHRILGLPGNMRPLPECLDYTRQRVCVKMSRSLPLPMICTLIVIILY